MSSCSGSRPDGQDASSDADNLAFSGFDEIENAFNSVSIAADSLLNSIRDDSLRGAERAKERRRKHSLAGYCTDSDNDTCNSDTDAKKFSPLTSNTPVSAYETYTGYRPTYCDDGSASGSGDSVSGGDDGDSIDGSLIQDIRNLKSVTKALHDDLIKEGAVFQATVTNGNGKTFFQKLEAASDAKTPHARNYNLKLNTTSTTKNTTPSTSTTSISVRPNSNSANLSVKASRQQPRTFLEQLRGFCNNLFGDKPSLRLLVVNILVWLVLFRIAYVANVPNGHWMDERGRLA